MKGIRTIVLIIICIIVNLVLNSMGYGINTWQYWVCYGCVVVSYFFGSITGFIEGRN